MKGKELKDFVKSNHKDFGGSMTNAEIAKQCEVSNARVSQIKKYWSDCLTSPSCIVSVEAQEPAEAV
jgi:hypothetical protein